ncbi:hypothetical protein M0R45_000220 [Rubus argutus]|uniref:Uncharacterized protein n=1 Tax=Rubus argutus TaxID=59490 RepID=A0AAW1VLA6_RUBAR
MGFPSLRDIQDEQIKIKERQPTRNKDHSEDPVITKSDGKILLSSFLPSKPYQPQYQLSQPLLRWHLKEKEVHLLGLLQELLRFFRPSLRDIQMQQGKQQQSLSHSPKTKTTGFSVTNSQGLPLDSSGLNRWFKPEVDAPSSIRSIQIEEKAMKDLRRFYNSVKVVKNPS